MIHKKKGRKILFMVGFLLSATSLVFSFGFDFGLGIQPTSDNGFVFVGFTDSHSYGKYDFMIYKLNENGDMIWSTNLGGNNNDIAFSVQQTSDGGFIVAGLTESFTNGKSDFLVYKLSATGEILWRKNYGGSNDDFAISIKEKPWGGYIVAGSSFSYSNGKSDFLVYSLDDQGNVGWFNHYGGPEQEQACSILITSDGYILAGTSSSYTNGSHDFLVYKLSPRGSIVWRKNYGGSGWEEASSIQQTSDNGYILLGSTRSFIPGKTQYLVYKTNSTGDILWSKNLGCTQGGESFGTSVLETDNGYVLAGNAFHPQNPIDQFFVLFNLDTQGNIRWERMYGGDLWDETNTLCQTNDGNIVIAGASFSYSNSFGMPDFLMYKVTGTTGDEIYRKNFGE